MGFSFIFIRFAETSAVFTRFIFFPFSLSKHFFFSTFPSFLPTFPRIKYFPVPDLQIRLDGCFVRQHGSVLVSWVLLLLHLLLLLSCPHSPLVTLFWHQEMFWPWLSTLRGVFGKLLYHSPQGGIWIPHVHLGVFSQIYILVQKLLWVFSWLQRYCVN